MATDDPFKALYDRIAERKGERGKVDPYHGGNGRIDRAVDLILNEDLPRSGSLLDVGGATGNLGYALREHFRTRWVMDISEAALEAAAKKGNNVAFGNVDVRGLPWTVPVFDLIVCLDVIEHIIDPEKFARECMRVLNPGGAVLINTPNIQFWRHLKSLVCDGVFPHTSGDREVYHGGHVAFYNLQDLKAIFGSVGFTDMRMWTRGLTADPPPPLWTNLFKSAPEPVTQASHQLSYADLIFSCRKPS
jgi:2-polyprenyl-3-methyl-5-hydroxy-6-metoxy-1,4-benzoquinol methylase